jgi:Zn finger protein HypA/HybF involved in hydrogenase expression
MSDLMLDGNAAAGTLQEIFAVEMTTVVGTCDSCGRIGEIGTLQLYRSAGLTLRCPTCEAVLMKIVTSGTRTWLDLRGVRSMQFDA